MAKFNVPVYLPDQTIVGSAETLYEIDRDRVSILIRLPRGSTVAQLFEEQLVGLSVLYMDVDRADEIQNKEGEETDDSKSSQPQ